jgi:hypothetical protein
MRYLQCGLAAEGPTDHRFLGPLLHRLVDSIVLRDRRYDVEIPDVQPVLPSGRPVNDPSDVSQAVKEEYGHLDLLFFHSDAKGNPQKAYTERVAMVDAGERCLVVGVVPRHETEAWVISQPVVIAHSLGVDVTGLGVAAVECHPDAVERNADPKATLRAMVSAVRGRRRVRREEDLLGVWAQRLDLVELQRLSQGRQLAEDTAAALRTLAVIR